MSTSELLLKGPSGTQENTSGITNFEIIQFTAARSPIVIGALEVLSRCVPEASDLPRTEIYMLEGVVRVAEPTKKDIVGQHVADIYRRIEAIKAKQDVTE